MIETRWELGTYQMADRISTKTKFVPMAGGKDPHYIAHLPSSFVDRYSAKYTLKIYFTLPELQNGR